MDSDSVWALTTVVGSDVSSAVVAVSDTRTASPEWIGKPRAVRHGRPGLVEGWPRSARAGPIAAESVKTVGSVDHRCSRQLRRVPVHRDHPAPTSAVI